MAVEFTTLQHTVADLQKSSPVPYNLHATLLKGRTDNERVLLMLHGMGSNHQIAEILQGYGDISSHLLSFDFPDAGQKDASKMTFGTFQEIFPVLYILKRLVIDGKITSLDLFGFSAGGGAVVNTIAVLNSNRYEAPLKAIGIGENERKLILQAIQNGTILLDVPLKSIREIIQTRGRDQALTIIEKRYKANGFEPIDALQYWKGLKMSVMVYFEVPDAILSNRDDGLFIERLKSFNEGPVTLFKGSYGGHAGYHTPLWKAYASHKG